MKPQIIPIIAGTPAQTFSIILNEISYIMTAKWNSRADFWTLDIADENNTVLINNVALKIGVDLLEPFNLGIGNIYVVNFSGGGIEPSLLNIGEETALIYIAPDE